MSVTDIAHYPGIQSHLNLCFVALPSLTRVHAHIGCILCRDESIAHVSGSSSSSSNNKLCLICYGSRRAWRIEWLCLICYGSCRFLGRIRVALFDLRPPASSLTSTIFFFVCKILHTMAASDAIFANAERSKSGPYLPNPCKRRGRASLHAQKNH